MSETDRLERLLQVGSLPPDLIDRETMRKGVVVLPIIGIIYMYGGLYYLNKKYFYPAIEHLIGLLHEKYAPTVYCALNTCIYMFIMIYSTLLSGTNVGIATILGSDAFNFFLLLGIIQYRVKNYTEIEVWVYLKDGLFYLGNLILAAIFFSFSEFWWWMAMVWMVYFGIYNFKFQAKNEPLRDKIGLMLGIMDEDDVFDSSEHYKMTRRRYSISEIMEKEEVNFDNPALKKKIRRYEGALKIQLKNKKKFPVYAKFQSMVLKVAYAIERRMEGEKRERAELFKEKVENAVQALKQLKQAALENEAREREAREEQMNELRRDEDETLIEKETKMIYPFVANNDDDFPGHKSLGNAGDVLSQSRVGATPRTPLDDEEEEENRNEDLALAQSLKYEVEPETMAIPDSAINKVLYFLFFPFNIFYFAVFYYLRRQINVKAAAVSIAIVLAIQAGLSFLIIWWTEVITSSLDIQSEVAGLSFTSIGFSISFAVYNLNLQKQHQDANFLTTFEMIGIYKFGFAASIGWILSFIIAGEWKTDFITKGFMVSALIYVAFFFVSVVLIGLNRARIPNTFSIPYIICYIVFFILAVTLTATLTSIN